MKNAQEVIDKLNEAFLPQNVDCDSGACMGCWKDVIREAIAMLERSKDNGVKQVKSIKPDWLPEIGVIHVRDLWNKPNDGLENPRLRAIELIQMYARAHGYHIDIQKASQIREAFCK